MVSKAFNTTLSGLNFDQSYIVRVRAINALGVKSEWSDAIVFNAGSGGGGSIDPFPPSNVTATAGLKSIIVSWSRAPVPYRYWELYVTDQTNISSRTTSIEEGEDEIGIPQFDGKNYYGTSTDTIQTITVACNELTDGSWTALRAETTYYVAIIGVSPSGKRSEPIWVSATTASLQNADIAAGAITADTIAAGELKVDVTLSGSITTTTSPSGAYVTIDSGGIHAYPNTASATPIFDVSTDTGQAEFTGHILGGSIDIGDMDNTSFHVDANGNLWLGSGTYATAPFKIDSSGNVELANNADLYVNGSGIVNIGLIAGDHFKMYEGTATGGSYAIMEFKHGSDSHGFLYFNSYNGDGFNEIKFGGTDDDLVNLMRIGLNINAGHSAPAHYYMLNGRTNEYRHQFFSDDTLILSMRRDDTKLDLRFNADMPTAVGGELALSMDLTTKQLRRAFSSSIDYKYNVVKLESELNVHERLMSMQPYVFTYKGGTTRQYGFIAEEMDLLDHNLVIYDKGKPEGVNVNNVVPLLVAGYQNLVEYVEQLEERLNERTYNND